MRDGAGERAVVVRGRRIAVAELGRGLADEVDRAHVRPDRGRERREALALQRAAEDQVHRLVRVRGERAPRGGDVRRLRVVDEAHAVDLADVLEPVRHARERPQRLGDRVVADPGRARRGRRGGGVLAVVRAADQRLGRQRVVGRELDPLEARARAARPSRRARSKIRSFASR